MRKYPSLCALTFAITIGCTDIAHAITVADGCATATNSKDRQVFYVDPEKGSMTNNGSAEKPWSTLAEVLENKRQLVATRSYSNNFQKGDQSRYEKNLSGVIKPGDIIYLNTGDHGNVQIAGALNNEFITVQAAPGQTPTLRSLRVNGASKWIFVGLKVQGANDGSTNSLPGYGLIELGRNLTLGPTDNILILGSSVSTSDDSTAWTNADWVKKPFMAGIASNATCVTISGNHFFNLRNVIGIDGDHSLVVDNKIENFGNDAIDIIASNVVIRKNSITGGRNSKADGMHADAIQGWTKNNLTNKNVTIDSNIIIKTGDPQVSYLQGICIFDGKWDGLTISNNVVVTNHWHGITVMGAANAKIVNNTVVAFDPVKYPTWITVQNAKDGTPSNNVVVRNNITTRLVHHGDKVIVDHNIVAKMIATSAGGKPVFIGKPGTHGDHNIIDPDIYNTLVRVDHSKEIYDLRLKPNSPAIGRGNPDLAPLKDITGKRRRTPVDIGAYARSN